MTPTAPRIKLTKYEIPFDIQEDIMKRLPVKSLIQFRSVSKAWKSLIDSSEFIAAHTLHRHTRPQHLLLSCHSYEYELEEEEDYVLFCQSYIDGDTFPQQKSLMTFPPQQIINSTVIGSSHGLVCLHGSDPNFKTNMAVICNPSIKKSIVVDVSAIAKVFGFGVCPITNDPKIVSIKHPSWDVPETSYRWEIMVYTLSSSKWRSLSSNLLTKRIHVFWCMVTTDRFIYWYCASQTCMMVMSFDVSNENLELIDLPDSLAHRDKGCLSFSTLRESLVMLNDKDNICTVWMMEHGLERSFAKLFTITTTDIVVGFTKNGTPIVNVTDDDGGQTKLVVYKPNSEHNNVICISESPYAFGVNSYMETLILLCRSDCISY